MITNRKMDLKLQPFIKLQIKIICKEYNSVFFKQTIESNTFICQNISKY